MKTGSDALSATNEIKELVVRWTQATAEKNLQSLLEMMDDEIVFLPPAGPAIRGKVEATVVYGRLFAQADGIESLPTIEEIIVSGEWAFLVGADELKLTMSATGERLHMKGRAVSILRRQSDGSWKFARGINNMMRVPGEGR